MKFILENVFHNFKRISVRLSILMRKLLFALLTDSRWNGCDNVVYFDLLQVVLVFNLFNNVDAQVADSFFFAGVLSSHKRHKLY